MRCVLGIRDVIHATNELACAIIRGIIGTYNLDDLFTQKEEIAAKLAYEIQEPTDQWGVVVERVEIKNVNSQMILCAYF